MKKELEAQKQKLREEQERVKIAQERQQLQQQLKEQKQRMLDQNEADAKKAAVSVLLENLTTLSAIIIDQFLVTQ